jgi:hypothetical protein
VAQIHLPARRGKSAASPCISSGQRRLGQAESGALAAAQRSVHHIILKIFDGRFCAKSVGEADNRSSLSDILAAGRAAPVNHDLITHHDNSSPPFCPSRICRIAVDSMLVLRFSVRCLRVVPHDRVPVRKEVVRPFMRPEDQSG